MTDLATTPQPECWCTYGREGLEFTPPGCPTHDPNGTPEPAPYVDPCDPNGAACAHGCYACNCTGCGGCMHPDEYFAETEHYGVDADDLTCSCGED